MHISNVRICSDADKPLRLKVRIKDDGKKELVYKEGKKEVVFREIRGAKAK
jgi:ribosomal protein L24